MKEIPYRSIFPNYNVPDIKYGTKRHTLTEKLSKEINSIINRVNCSEFEHKIKELEFKVDMEVDPAIALIKKLNEISHTTN